MRVPVKARDISERSDIARMIHAQVRFLDRACHRSLTRKLSSTFAIFGVRRFITAFLSLLLATFLKVPVLEQSCKNQCEARKESGNQSPQSKWNGKSRAKSRRRNNCRGLVVEGGRMNSEK